MPQMLPHKFLRSLLPGLISAGIVFALCWVIFWLKDYAPFGTGTLATQDAYQALGRVCYRMLSDNEMPEGAEVQRHLQTIASLQQQLQDLKATRAVE